MSDHCPMCGSSVRVTYSEDSYHYQSISEMKLEVLQETARLILLHAADPQYRLELTIEDITKAVHDALEYDVLDSL